MLELSMKEIQDIWLTIQNHQIVFHPEISPMGIFDINKLFQCKNIKPIILFLDRNILSSLLKLCKQGFLKNKEEMQIVGLIMVWTMINDIPISSGFALQEHATKTGDQEQALIELQYFLDIFERYPFEIWLKVAKGELTKISPLKCKENISNCTTIDYSNGCDHYYITLASLLHSVVLYRNKNLTIAEKMMRFLEWTYDNVLVSEYIIVYVALYFSGQEKIKTPKGANSNDFSKIVSGCENQAWDISYLSNWSTYYTDTKNYKEEFLFATNDDLLKRIFINKNSFNSLSDLFDNIFSQKDYINLSNLITEKTKNRKDIYFGKNSSEYFKKLIDIEKQYLIDNI